MKNKFMLVIMIGLMMCFPISAYSDSVYIEDYDLNVEYNSAISDEIFSLTLGVTSDANTAKNLTIEFDGNKQFDFISDEDWTLSIEPGETISKTFRIEVDDDVESKNYDLEFNLDDGNDDWDDKFNIKVSSDSADIKIGEIVSSPKKIFPGSEDVALDITIKNKGDIDAEDLIATLILPEGFEASSSYSNIVHVGDLNSGDSQTITFYFDTNKILSKESYLAEIKLDYESNGDGEVTILNMVIPIFPIPQFEIINIQTLTDTINKGSTEEIKIAIKNIGRGDAQDVSLKVYERSDQPFTFNEKSSYVGSIKVGQTGYAIFEFDVDHSATSTNYFIDFQIRSINGNSVIVDDLTTSINVQDKETNFEILFISGILGVTLLGSFIFFFARRF